MNFQKRLAALLVAAAVMVACGTAAPATDALDAIEGDAQTVATPATGDEVAAPGAEGAPGEMPTMPELGENVVTTDSGLQYEDTVVGEGTEAQTGDIVSVHYSGFLEDGTMFDSSVTRGQPFQFTLGTGGVIQGWDEGVPGMQIGGKRTLVIPADLAYGEAGQPPTIPPNSPLTFEVELLDVQTPPEPTSVEEGDYTTTESGLQYVILTEGEGEEVEEGQMVTVNYNGWVEGGTLFDSSEQSGQPIQFIVGDTQLEGLNEGTVGMKVGEKRQLRIPAELAFGAEGAGDMIPPDSTIIFELELLEIQDVPEMTEVEEEEYTTTESGLEYTILSEGEGDVAETGDTVAVHYTGFFEDGSVFDSSIPRGEPLTFTIGSGQVIPGWEEGVTGMKVGELRQLRVPPELGYGAEGFGSIPPDATLLFQVELVEIVTGNE
ncbi:MAG TPA: FKBP-type peptidyl-prolyl cis-trans isomerase [Ardenticatenaceae bacterium]|jgi:FKBP-type peptidyl-prolyl cis-trans isomerase